MISVIITSFKEPKTIGRAIESVLNQNLENYEIIVVAPDHETLNVAKKYSKDNVKTLKDPGKGKPTALNLVFKKARGNILVLTDGDVYISPSSIKSLLGHFTDAKVGAVTGRVCATNSKKSFFGRWAQLTADAFHLARQKEHSRAQNIVCSGYLYAIRKSLAPKLPSNILADDAYIAYSIQKKGYRTVYEPSAKVNVTYPTTLPDWIRQKKRTASRFYQLESYFKISKKDSLLSEISAALGLLTKIDVSDILALFTLSIFRLYIWARVYLDRRLWTRSFSNVWQRVESTK